MKTMKTIRGFGRAMLLGTAMLLAGCTFGEYRTPTTESMKAFDEAGPVLPQVSAGDYGKDVRPVVGPYRIVAGDVLAVQVAPREGGESFSTVRGDVAQAGIPARVAKDGTIRLPYATETLKVGGLTLAEAEEAITGLYFPKYLKQTPLVFVQMRDYQTRSVAISGGVAKPGRYEARADRMTLLSLLSEAGGLTQTGTPVVRIKRDAKDGMEGKTIVLTATRGKPLGDDIQLVEGDLVEVEMIPSNTVTVIGLVNTPGRFDCAAGSSVTLIQALSYAGGVNWVADPKFARIYRVDAKGQLVTADFMLSDGRSPMGAANTVLKPGDVVAVEQTKQTATYLFLAKSIQAGLNLDLGMIYTIGKDVRFSGGGGGN